jgi:hypothetical protein
MAVTYTATLEPQNHRELITYVDSFGLKSRLYIYASQVASRASVIQSHLQIAQANESNMTALQAAHIAAQGSPAATSAATPAATPPPAPLATPQVAKAATPTTASTPTTTTKA